MRKFFKSIMVLLNIIAILALILVKVGSVVSPGKFMIAAYISLGLFPILLVNLFFIVFWLFLRKGWIFMSLIALILFSGIAKSSFPINLGKSNIDKNRQKITLLSYNTMSMGEMKKHTSDNPNKIIQYILKSDADIVCLQEMAVSENAHQFQMADFDKIFEKYPYKHVSFKLNKWNMHAGLVTMSKYPIVNKHLIDFKAAFNLSMYSDIVIGKDTVRLINNHLESNRITAKDMQRTSNLRKDFNSDELGDITKYLSRKLIIAYKVRAKQADKVDSIVKESPYKVILCGDFNDVPSSYAYTKVKGNLKDAFKETGIGLGHTFNRSFFLFRIDYIMYDEAFQSSNYKRGNLKSSDHYPIQADLYLSKK